METMTFLEGCWLSFLIYFYPGISLWESGTGPFVAAIIGREITFNRSAGIPDL